MVTDSSMWFMYLIIKLFDSYMAYKYPPNLPFALTLLVIVFLLAGISLYRVRKSAPEYQQQQSTSDSYFFSMESNDILENVSTIKIGNAHSGNRSCVLNSTTEYGVTYSVKSADLRSAGTYKEILFSFYIFAASPISAAKVVYSLDLEDGKNGDWQSEDIIVPSGPWKKVEIIFLLNDEFRNGKGLVKLFVWNKNKENFLIDDMLIQFK